MVSALKATRSSVVKESIELRALSWSAVMELNWLEVRLFRSSLLSAANCVVVIAATCDPVSELSWVVFSPSS